MQCHVAFLLPLLISLASAAKTSLKALHYNFPMQQSSYEYGLFKCDYAPGTPAYDREWLQLFHAICLAALFHTHQLYGNACSKQSSDAFTTSRAKDVIKTQHQHYIVADLIRTFLPSASFFDAEANCEGVALVCMVNPFEIFDIKEPVLACSIPSRPRSAALLTLKHLGKNLKDRCVMILNHLRGLPGRIYKETKIAMFVVFGPQEEASYLKFSVDELLHGLCFPIVNGSMSVECARNCNLLNFALIKQRFPILAIPQTPRIRNFHYSQGRFGCKRSWNRMFVSFFRVTLHRMHPETDKDRNTFITALLECMHQLFPNASIHLMLKPEHFKESFYCKLTESAEQIVLSDDINGELFYSLQFDQKQPAVSDETLLAISAMFVDDGFAIMPLLYPPPVGSIRHRMLQIIHRVVLEQQVFDNVEPFILKRLLLHMHLGITHNEADTEAGTYFLPTEHFVLISTAFPQLVSPGNIVAVMRKSGKPLMAKIGLLVTGFDSGNERLSFLTVYGSGDPFQMLH